MDNRLNDYDWSAVFVVSGETADSYLSIEADLRRADPTSSVSLDYFGRADVAEIYGISEGERDEANWLIYGKLRDGRYFSISAGCDYTGWDCQASGVAFVAETKQEIEMLGLDPSERVRLGVESNI